jgi:pyroglutamyl-peptidase
VPRRVLVAGFEPFAGDSFNPSAVLARRLAGRSIAGHRITGCVLPVDSSRVGSVLRGTLAAEAPDMVLLTGLAAGRSGLSLERGARNRLDFDLPDNSGRVIRGEMVVQDGAEHLFTNLPLDAVLAAWQAAGIPGRLSESAGTYVCNQAFYEVLALNVRSIPIGFVHLPCTPEQARARAGGAEPCPSLELDEMVRGVELAIATTLSVAA